MCGRLFQPSNIQILAPGKETPPQARGEVRDTAGSKYRMRYGVRGIILSESSPKLAAQGRAHSDRLPHFLSPRRICKEKPRRGDGVKSRGLSLLIGRYSRTDGTEDYREQTADAC